MPIADADTEADLLEGNDGTNGIVQCVGFVFVDTGSPHLALDIVGCSIVMVLSGFVVWHYWQGRNWARMLVIATALVALANLGYWDIYGYAGKALIGFEAILAAFLLWWLNTNTAR